MIFFFISQDHSPFHLRNTSWLLCGIAKLAASLLLHVGTFLGKIKSPEHRHHDTYSVPLITTGRLQTDLMSRIIWTKGQFTSQASRPGQHGISSPPLESPVQFKTYELLISKFSIRIFKPQLTKGSWNCEK